MNKRGDSETILTGNVIYIILFIIFFLIVFTYIVAFQDGAATWQDFYAKEIALTIDSLYAGSTVSIDISKARAIALEHKVPPEKIITIDNVNRLVEVRLTPDSVSRFPFFTEVEIRDPQLEIIEGTYSFTIQSRGKPYG